MLFFQSMILAYSFLIFGTHANDPQCLGFSLIFLPLYQIVWLIFFHDSQRQQIVLLMFLPFLTHYLGVPRYTYTTHFVVIVDFQFEILPISVSGIVVFLYIPLVFQSIRIFFISF